MNKKTIISKLRTLRSTYGVDAVTCTEMETDLKSARFPPAVVSVAVSAFKNALKVTELPGGHSRLSGNELARIALNTAIGSAKRNLFGAY